MNILNEIFAHKRSEVARQKEIQPLAQARAAAERAAPPLDFLAGLEAAAPRPALIAEIKRRSPSRGLLAPHLNPRQLARLYAQNGAAAISVLTDEPYFGGNIEHLRSLAGRPRRLPLLRKDFICDPYQVYESRAAGADALLLIVAGLEPAQLRALHRLTLSLNMIPLVEVHTLEELKLALDLEPALVGINNRDLRDFSVRLETTLHLRPHIPPGVKVVAESGIHTADDIACLSAAGVDAVLVGEAIVTAADIARKVRELAGKGNNL